MQIDITMLIFFKNDILCSPKIDVMKRSGLPWVVVSYPAGLSWGQGWELRDPQELDQTLGPSY